MLPLFAAQILSFQLEWASLAICEMGHNLHDYVSGAGQTRHFDRAPITSGLPLLADNFRAGQHVSKVPIS